jgi:hypothetical protein
VPDVLYGSETWSLTLREEHRLRVFDNKVLRRIFRTKRDKVIGEWRKMHCGKLHNLYSIPKYHYAGQFKENKVGGVHMAYMGEGRQVCKVLVGKLEGKRLLGRSRHR